MLWLTSDKSGLPLEIKAVDAMRKTCEFIVGNGVVTNVCEPCVWVEISPGIGSCWGGTGQTLVDVHGRAWRLFLESLFLGRAFSWAWQKRVSDLRGDRGKSLGHSYFACHVRPSPRLCPPNPRNASCPVPARNTRCLQTKGRRRQRYAPRYALCQNRRRPGMHCRPQCRRAVLTLPQRLSNIAALHRTMLEVYQHSPPPLPLAMPQHHHHQQSYRSSEREPPRKRTRISQDEQFPPSPYSASDRSESAECSPRSRSSMTIGSLLSRDHNSDLPPQD